MVPSPFEARIPGGRALVFEVAPKSVHAFGKGEVYSQTTRRFG